MLLWSPRQLHFPGFAPLLLISVICVPLAQGETGMQQGKLGRRAFLQLAATTTAGALLAACAPVAAPQAAGPGEAAAEGAALIYWNYMTDMEEIEGDILEA